MCSVGCIPPVPMRAASFSSFRAFCSLAFSAPCPCRGCPLGFSRTASPRLCFLPSSNLETCPFFTPFNRGLSASPVEQLETQEPHSGDEQPHQSLVDTSVLDFAELRSLHAPPPCEVKELEELPEQWRRSRLAWLCKELPAHKPATVIRILNGQRKWMRQEDVTYVIVHCMRIRENDTGFRVYKWMIQQHWFHFDFALATRLADYLGKDRRFSKCHEIFDQIINQGHVPCESTFHILVVAYLCAPVQGCLEEACSIYNRMIQLGGYKPRLSLHNSLFRAITSKPGGSAKYYLTQAEFIFHNIVTSKLETHKDIYGGLIWLHSYQDIVDKERIAALRAEMQQGGIKEGLDVLVSILRICAKEGNVEEAERTWVELLDSGHKPSSQAFVYRMEVYSQIGNPMKSLEIFREMQEQMPSPSAVSFHKIIEVMVRAQETEVAEALMKEFMDSGLKPLTASFLEIMDMYLKLNLHDKVESLFSDCLSKCSPSQTVYNIYLDSAVRSGNLGKAEEIFQKMHIALGSGVNSRSCNILLGGYLAAGEHVKAEDLYREMCEKKYDIEHTLVEKVEFIVSLKGKKVVNKPIKLKLDKEQREILMGLLLGGLRMESDDERNHMIHFEFGEHSDTHSVLKMHVHKKYHEWLNSSGKATDAEGKIPQQFSTIKHPSLSFFADQFRPKGRPVIPKLIHRWLSPRVIAYWYMYGGLRTNSGDILLKLKGASDEEVAMLVKTLKAKSLDCKVKRKQKIFWIGFQGSNAVWFWKQVEPYIPCDLNDLLGVDSRRTVADTNDSQELGFDAYYSELEGNASDTFGDHGA